MPPSHKLPPWLRPKTPPSLELAVGWYDEHDWLAVKTAAVDPDRFEESYAEWLAMAEGAFADLRSAGLSPKRCHVKADQLLAWCLAHDKVNDAANRAAFVAEQGRQRG
jgi:hypothetical protein